MTGIGCRVHHWLSPPTSYKPVNTGNSQRHNSFWIWLARDSWHWPPWRPGNVCSMIPYILEHKTAASPVRRTIVGQRCAGFILSQSFLYQRIKKCPIRTCASQQLISSIQNIDKIILEWHSKGFWILMFNEDAISNLTQRAMNPRSWTRMEKLWLSFWTLYILAAQKRYRFPSFWKWKYGRIGLVSGMSAIADFSRVWTR